MFALDYLLCNFTDKILCYQVWNRALCEMDSDQDGVTNGAELCDPDCTWAPSQAAPTCNGANLPSHPGWFDALCLYPFKSVIFYLVVK